MIHLNPYYLFSHVVFINLDKNFISIEKNVYQNIHSLLFRGRRSTPQQRKELRILFYNTYYSYLYKKKEVDVNKFNLKIEQIVNRITVREFNHETVVTDADNDTLMVADKPLFVDDSIVSKDVKIDNPQVQDKITRFLDSSLSKYFETELIDDINHQCHINDTYKVFIDFLGFNRCLNILKKFVFENKYVLKNDVEFEFLKISLSFISSYRLKFFKRHFDFICGDCFNISDHFNTIEERRNHVTCYRAIWFNKDGILNLKFGVQDRDYANGVFFDHRGLTGFSNAKSFRLGYFEYNVNTSFDIFGIERHNNNYLAFKSFLNQARSFSNMQELFRERNNILKYNDMVKNIENNLSSDTFNEDFKNLKELYDLIVNRLDQPVEQFSVAFGQHVTTQDSGLFTRESSADSFAAFFRRN